MLAFGLKFVKRSKVQCMCAVYVLEVHGRDMCFVKIFDV